MILAVYTMIFIVQTIWFNRWYLEVKSHDSR